MVFKGDLKKCTELFKSAGDAHLPVAQINLANAYYAMHWAEDMDKDFSALTLDALESYIFVLRGQTKILMHMYNKSYDFNWDTCTLAARKTINEAIALGSVYAKLIHI